jgi:hypothetical protein
MSRKISKNYSRIKSASKKKKKKKFDTQKKQRQKKKKKKTIVAHISSLQKRAPFLFCSFLPILRGKNNPIEEKKKKMKGTNKSAARRKNLKRKNKTK